MSPVCNTSTSPSSAMITPSGLASSRLAAEGSTAAAWLTRTWRELIRCSPFERRLLTSSCGLIIARTSP
jgi:hypothetical protein